MRLRAGSPTTWLIGAGDRGLRGHLVLDDFHRLDLREETLRGLWAELRRGTRTSLAENKMSIVELMQQYGEEWQNVGTPFLKLATDSSEAERPFSLISGYVGGISLSNTTIATPMAGVIFGECRVPGLGRYYYTLLRKAAERSAVVRRLLDSQERYGAAAVRLDPLRHRRGVPYRPPTPST